ncbi:YciI family protein [Gulosibacter molinativorax]|uniref:YCII-related domain-containing protein n=1 Tax=Gulosibacter molinativorax TaxID=256821 RepID=A0ABT7C7I9_9MICO|nr:YciI family protein [Gulosibacter molinativorax]MDJ1371025.1 hypothetical protein [Gulosibacter molinativorax]QUY62820.1 Hypotetical protein [Gulosibacter molinativorax]
MQFVVIGYDVKDGGKLRAEHRPEHIDVLNNLDGIVLSAGAFLDEDGNPAGSSMHFEFPSQEAFDAYLAQEPLIKHGVWERVESYAFRQSFSNPSAS